MYHLCILSLVSLHTISYLFDVCKGTKYILKIYSTTLIANLKTLKRELNYPYFQISRTSICLLVQLVCQMFFNQKAKRRIIFLIRRFSRIKRRVVLLKWRFVMSDLQRFTNAIISFLFAMLILNWTISKNNSTIFEKIVIEQ